MKRLSLVGITMMVILLCFAPMGWAGEVSVFDEAQGLIIRAYTGPGATLGYAVYLEVRGTDGNLLDTSKVTVTGLLGTANPTNKFIVVPPSSFTAEYIIHSDNVASSDISLSYDNSFHTAYLFCTDVISSPAMVMKYGIASLLSVPGSCGTADRGAFYSLTSTDPNLCSAGTLTSFAGSGPWTWTCSGLNGGANSGQCSANLKVNGACGSSNGGTFTSAPTTNLCSAGTLTSFAGSGPWTWTCSGLNGGTPSPTCSAQIQSTGGSVDLIVVSMTGISSSYEYGGSFNINWSVKNQGTAPSGPFTVKLYQNGSKAMGGSLLFTVPVSGLAAGQSTGGTNSASTSAICSIHVYCYFNLWVDADNQVAESNETNNEKSGQSERAR